jgi:hypothetical protein
MEKSTSENNENQPLMLSRINSVSVINSTFDTNSFVSLLRNNRLKYSPLAFLELFMVSPLTPELFEEFRYITNLQFLNMSLHKTKSYFQKILINNEHIQHLLIMHCSGGFKLLRTILPIINQTKLWSIATISYSNDHMLISPRDIISALSSKYLRSMLLPIKLPIPKDLLIALDKNLSLLHMEDSWCTKSTTGKYIFANFQVYSLMDINYVGPGSGQQIDSGGDLAQLPNELLAIVAAGLDSPVTLLQLSWTCQLLRDNCISDYVAFLRYGDGYRDYRQHYKQAILHIISDKALVHTNI